MVWKLGERYGLKNFAFSLQKIFTFSFINIMRVLLITHLEFPFLVHHAGKMRSSSRWPGVFQAALGPQETRSRLIV